MFSIHEELERLSQKYRFFASKEAFKQSLKFQLQEKFRVEENKRFHDYLIDLWVEEPESGRQYAICLMNKLARVTIKQNGQTIELKHHGAQDQGRYDFLAQVEKLERITMGRRNVYGIVVLLTNDHLYWTEPMRPNTVDCEFRIHENRIITGELKWQERASAGTKKTVMRRSLLKGL